jgi:hypothetical protein
MRCGQKWMVWPTISLASAVAPSRHTTLAARSSSVSVSFGTQLRTAQPTSRTSVPTTTTPEREYILKEIRKNPYVQAIPGRQGFPKKSEQEALAKQFEGELPAAPWGRSAVDDIRHALAQVVAAGGKVSKQAKEAAENAAKKSDDAAKELEDLRLKASVAEGRGERILSLRKQLEAAEKKAKFYEDQFNKIKKRAFPGSGDQ